MRHKLASVLAPIFVLTSLLPLPTSRLAFAEEKVGTRPYEMVWAGRNEDEHAPLVDFEELDGWTVQTTGSVATFERSREEQMFGQYVGKLTYRAEGEGAPQIDIRPPKPIKIDAPNATAYTCWIYGNNWAWENDTTTPRVKVYALFQNAEGKEIQAPLVSWHVQWKEWFLNYQTIKPELKADLGDQPSFAGFRILGGTNKEDRVLYFDSLCFFQEELKPLEFKPRAKPGIELFEGQDLGINSGEGRLPFPTNEDTILPTSGANKFKPAFHFYGDSCDFVYEGEDGTLVYRYKPTSGNWSDVTARWNNGAEFYPCAQGGVKELVGENGAVEQVEKSKLVSFKQAGEGAVALWELASKTAKATVEYRLQIKAKSLVVDTIARGGNAPSVSLGRLERVDNPRVYSIPYYLYDYTKRPGVAVFKPIGSDVALFASAHIDWYRSGASYLSGQHGVGAFEEETLEGKLGAKKSVKRFVHYAYLNGSADYHAKTDGKRNDVYERFVFTISPKFEETLPSIANPVSPYRSVAGKGVWRSHGASTREGDKKYWRNIWRHGMRHIVVTDHEVCWRDGGESFTFRTKPAPGKGGDQGWIDYSRFMQDTLGFVYGPYNNFTDFAPVNEYWSPDMVNRRPSGALQEAWTRCYAPKPTRAVEYCEKLTPINQEKFQFSCAYCDVHSSVPPWTRTDYDARVPGAGTFMSVYYPYGEIFLLQKKNWKGPTYSEGPHHCFYAGLTDGNYAQDQPYNLFKNQWLLDFDLLKIHPLEVNFGMGNLHMFSPGYRPNGQEEINAYHDRFLAATLAFGHSGFLALDYGVNYGARSYFMVQQIASRYTQSAVASIRYLDAEGNWLDTSAALVADVVKRSQVCVHYEDGTVVVSNGSTSLDLNAEVDGKTISLPPNGYTAWTADGKIVVESYLSASGKRFDYCVSPEYIYIDGRGTTVERPLAIGKGQGVCRILEGGRFEIIPYNGAEVGFKIANDDEELRAVALNHEGEEIAETTVKRARGFAYVNPVEGAFSYMVTKTGKGERALDPTCARLYVAAGETVEVATSNGSQTAEIPESAPLGRYWATLNDGSAIDFEVVAPIRTSVAYDSKTNALTLDVKANIPGAKIEYACLSKEYRALTFDEEARATETIAFATPEEEGTEEKKIDFNIELANGKKTTLSVPLQFETTAQYLPFDDYQFLDAEVGTDGKVKMTPFVQYRGKEATTVISGTNATHYLASFACGGVTKKCRFLHPPYAGGAGRVFLRYDFQAPDESVAFRMSVGRKDGSDSGDGIKFQIAVAEFDEAGNLKSEQTLAETVVLKFNWQELEADLSAYAGKRISLLVISDAGDKNDTSGDWGCAAEMRLESSQTQLIRELK